MGLWVLNVFVFKKYWLRTNSMSGPGLGAGKTMLCSLGMVPILLETDIEQILHVSNPYVDIVSAKWTYRVWNTHMVKSWPSQRLEIQKPWENCEVLTLKNGTTPYSRLGLESWLVSECTQVCSCLKPQPLFLLEHSLWKEANLLLQTLHGKWERSQRGMGTDWKRILSITGAEKLVQLYSSASFVGN